MPILPIVNTLHCVQYMVSFNYSLFEVRALLWYKGHYTQLLIEVHVVKH